jgi:hypothetical protein
MIAVWGDCRFMLVLVVVRSALLCLALETCQLDGSASSVASLYSRYVATFDAYCIVYV